jgi:hypothetical protein
MKWMKLIEKISPQTEIDELCEFFRQLDGHLASPRYGLPDSYYKYFKANNDKRLWMVTKYFRNIAALDKLEACIETLDSFFVGAEYFQSKIVLARISSPFSKEYSDKFFLSVVADSLRSSLDMMSKFLAWYFWLPEKEEIGFSYKKLVVPLRTICPPVADKCNSILQSKEFKMINEFRNTDKHIGQGKRKIAFVKTEKGFSITTERPEGLELNELKLASADLFFQVKELIHLSTIELQQWPLGYDAVDDENLELTGEGTFTSPK